MSGCPSLRRAGVHERGALPLPCADTSVEKKMMVASVASRAVGTRKGRGFIGTILLRQILRLTGSANRTNCLIGGVRGTTSARSLELCRLPLYCVDLTWCHADFNDRAAATGRAWCCGAPEIGLPH